MSPDTATEPAVGGRPPGDADLPPAAQRWLEAALGPTDPAATSPGQVRLHVRGAICRAPGEKWLDWEGRQSFEVGGLGFHWQARIRIARFLWADAEDRLDDDGGYGGGRLMGLIPAGSARGPQVTRSQLVRNLAELAFAPSVVTRAHGLVLTADGNSAFELTAPGIDPGAAVRAVVDEHGDIRQARSPDRPRESGRGTFLHEPYRLEFEAHTRLASGERIPLRATGTFETAGGNWPYWRFEVIEVG